ncbi:hypothetical protein FRC04_011563 [Tulasnella sp. 424]|nr:hypothetical protein FRC04_011563 [Tulasnella sp. 424]
MAQPPPNPASTTQKSVIDNYEPNISPRFGHVEDFWKRYDELADRSDREMVSNLNGNLDVLLIFAGLFSAVNTTFISTAMPSLSPDPSDRTNALLERLVLRFENASVTPAETSPPFSPSRGSITANCFLYTSLCCSLSAAMGAMLAKEWLQSYSRSGQAGPLEEQVRFRQKKYTAAQEGHLESVILFLPNLLLLSVLLFFAGLVFFLFPINSTVAAVVIAFFGVGMALSGVTIVAGAISPLSPFQTAISRALRRTLGLPFWCWKGLKRLLKRLAGIPKFRHGMRWIGARLRRRKEELQEFLGLTDASVRGDEDESTRPSSLHVALSEDGHRVVRSVRDRVLQRPVLVRASGFIEKWVTTPIGTHAQPIIRIFKPSTPDNPESVEGNDRDQHLVNAQAASWLLEMTSSLEDQLTVAQNICFIDPTACDIPALHPGLWRRLLSLTAEAIRACQKQLTDRNRSVAEQFGNALYHLLLCYPRNHELWSQLKQELPVDLFQSRGAPILIELSYALWGVGIGNFPPLPRQSYSFRKMMLHNIVVDLQDQWLPGGGRTLNGPYDDAMLSLIGLQISLRIGKKAASMDIRIGQNLQDVASRAYLGYVS